MIQNPTGCTIGENRICSYQEKSGSNFLLSFTKELPLSTAKPNTKSTLSDKSDCSISSPLTRFFTFSSDVNRIFASKVVSDLHTPIKCSVLFCNVYSAKWLFGFPQEDRNTHNSAINDNCLIFVIVMLVFPMQRYKNMRISTCYLIIA